MIPINTQVAMPAIRALLRYRDRIDDILATKAAAADLPFLLPPVGFETAKDRKAMLAYFRTDEGQIVLRLKNRHQDFDDVAADPTGPQNRTKLLELLRLYFDASGVEPTRLGPGAGQMLDRAQRPDEPGLGLAYYVVTSRRLSDDTELARVLITTADTALEFLGENASQFVSSKKTAAIVGTFLDEFAIKRDFDDLNGKAFLQSLLGATLTTASEHPPATEDQPALGALFGAIADFREKFDDEAAARLLTTAGFTDLLGTYIGHVAEDAALLTDNEPLRRVLTATLSKLQTNLPEIMADPKAALGILEVALTTAAGEVQGLLSRKLHGEPLLSAVTEHIAARIQGLGQKHRLFRSIATGEIVPDLLRTSLVAIAENPDAFAQTVKVDQLVSRLITGAAGIAARKELGTVFEESTLQDLTRVGLKALADNPKALGADSEFAGKLVASTLASLSSALADGLTLDEAEAALGHVVREVTENIHLFGLNGRLIDVLDAIGQGLGTTPIQALLSPGRRQQLVQDVLGVVAANPRIWSKLGDDKLIAPLVQNVMAGLAEDPTKLLSENTMSRAIQGVLAAAARRGNALLEEEVEPGVLRNLLAKVLERFAGELGEGMDGQLLPDLLENVAATYLVKPFAVTASASSNTKLNKLVAKAVTAVGSA